MAAAEPRASPVRQGSTSAYAARHRDHPRRRALSEQQSVLEGVIHMPTTSIQTPVRRDGTLLRTARAVGGWFSRAVNAIGQPYAKPEADHWADWPHFPPF
jgi:hypothetical protein